ncbi:MAG: hypothetical protein HYX53_15720 [Chloroflexi bacterium]|nr:hypothetical protein [Chloroflexota bacterium]
MTFRLGLASLMAVAGLTTGVALAQSPSPTTTSPATGTVATPSPTTPTATATAAGTVAPTATPTPTLPFAGPPPIAPGSTPTPPQDPPRLRAWPGDQPDSWYVYGANFQPRTEWLVGEVSCGSVPCARPLIATANDLGSEDSTLGLYIELPPAPAGAETRLLAAVPGGSAGSVSGTAPSVRVPARQPGVGLGYPLGTRTGIAEVDEVIALTQANDAAGLIALLAYRDAIQSVSREPVRGLASWQCEQFVRSETAIPQFFEYPGGQVYAVFRIGNDRDLPLRYKGAEYGIAWAGRYAVPFGGLTLVGGGRIVGVELPCGKPPGFFLRDFTDFVLSPSAGPAPVAPGAPATGSGRADSSVQGPLFLGSLAMVLAATATLAVTLRRRRR